MTQPRVRRAQPRLIFINCLYLAKFNPVLSIGAIAQMVERRNDDLEVATSLCFPSLFYWKDVVFIVMYLR